MGYARALTMSPDGDMMARMDVKTMVKRDFVRGGIDTVSEPVVIVTRDGRTLGTFIPGAIEQGTRIAWSNGPVGGDYVTPPVVSQVRLKPSTKDPAWLKGGR